MEVLKVVDLSKAYGNKTLFENISFVANSYEKIALIGKNGSGKTSLLDIITGKDIADSGQLSLNKSVSYTYLEQEPKFNEDLNVLEQVYQSSDQIALAVKQYELAMNSGDENAVNEAINLMDSLNAWEFEREIKTILSVLKITEFDKQVSILSGGQKKRLALANALVNKPDFLILDEPTNHLDFQMIEWLEDYLKSTSLTLLMVTHDRYFLDKVCNTIFEIDNYSIFKYSGTYSNFLEKRQERMDSTKASIQKAQNLLRIESKWMSRQPQARATKAKHRIDNYYKLKEDASKKLDESTFEIEIEGKRLGKKLIDIYNISKSFGDQVIINDFSFKFSKGEKNSRYW
jgi:ATP-binding cassette subfamily F protein uup